MILSKIKWTKSENIKKNKNLITLQMIRFTNGNFKHKGNIIYIVLGYKNEALICATKWVAF